MDKKKLIEEEIEKLIFCNDSVWRDIHSGYVDPRDTLLAQDIRDLDVQQTTLELILKIIRDCNDIDDVKSVIFVLKQFLQNISYIDYL